MAIPNDRNLVITGFMGTGKTTVGTILARQLARPFIDTDGEIVKRAGKSIPEIFAQDGEPAFRQYERDLVAELAARRGLVIATGGGMLVNAENRDRMLRSALVVCLDASAEVIGARLSRESGRPLAQHWADLLEQRREAYAAIPTHVNTAECTPEQVAERIMGLWQTEST